MRATVVGRHAQTTAAIAVIGMANVGLGLLIAAGLGASGIETMTWGRSLLFRASLCVVGLVFAGVAAVTVQVT